jgi:hypothetical protein
MRTSFLSLVLALTAVSLAACAAPTDATEGDVGSSAQALFVKVYPAPPPIRLLPPSPLPAYTTAQGYAGSPLEPAGTQTAPA